MNDYYSQFPQPSVDVRARNLVNDTSRNKIFREHFTSEELKAIAYAVAEVSKEYSMSGYNVFGFAEERKRMWETCLARLKSSN